MNTTLTKNEIAAMKLCINCYGSSFMSDRECQRDDNHSDATPHQIVTGKRPLLIRLR